MRRRHLAGRAGRARADRHAGEIERDHQGRRLDPRGREAQSVGQPRRGGAEDDRVRDGLANALGQTIAQRQETTPLGGRLVEGGANRRAEPGDRRHALRARPNAALLPAAANQRLADADLGVGDDERARALRTADLVGRERQRIRAERRQAEVETPGQLDGVAKNEAARGVDDGRRLGDRLDHAGLVIRPLQREQRPAGPPAASREPVEIDPAVGDERRDLDRGGGKPVALQDARVLPGRNDQAVERRLVRPDAEARIEARLTASVAPDAKVTQRVGTPARRRDFGPGPLDDPPRRASLRMHRGRVADRLHRREHRRTRFGANGRRRVVIEIGPRPGSAAAIASPSYTISGRLGRPDLAVFACNLWRLACYEAASERASRRPSRDIGAMRLRRKPLQSALRRGGALRRLSGSADRIGGVCMPEVFFNGPAGRLEGRFHPAKQRGAPIAVVLHPHPQFGGTMNNQIVYNTYYNFAERGFSVLRFNFRGVGRSQGAFDHGQGELSDAASALDWAQSISPEARACWIAGVSFGSWIGMQLLMRRPEIEGFISIAPPANRFDFSFLAPCPSSGLFVHGDKDRVAPLKEVQALIEKLKTQKGIVIEHAVIPKANHFFEDCIDDLQATVGAYLDKRLGMPRHAPAPSARSA